MKASGMLSFFLLAASAASVPHAQFAGFPGFPGSGGGGFGGSSNTANDVTNKAPCAPLTVIFARGTGENGNIGSVAGPPLLKALQSKLSAKNVAFQGVPYPASAAVSI